MADYGPFQVGNASEPITGQSPANSSLKDADPALFYALDFWTYVINTYPGPRILTAAAASGATQIQYPVAQAYPSNPGPHLQDNQFQFPLLAAWRTRTLSGRKTASWEHDRGMLDVLYVLPPLSQGQSELILPLQKEIFSALRHKTTQGWDPGYTPPGGTLGQPIWQAAAAGVEDAGFGDPFRDMVESAKYEFLDGAGNLLFPTVYMTAFFTEREMYVPATNKFTGADITVNLINQDQTSIPAFAQVATQQAPTITSLSVTSGTHLGGTSTTITGTLFLSGPPLVFFGGTRAFTVTYNSATSLTVTTPASAGAGTVDLTVLNRDGQSATLAQSFTYT